MLRQLYSPTLGLLTDLYQITMAYGYWKSGLSEVNTTFQLFFRKAPFGGTSAVTAGLETALQLIEQFSFSTSDIEYLRTQTGNDGKTLFEEAFLQYLFDLKIAVDIDGIPEGTSVLAHTPIIRVTGNVVHCQLLESALLTCMNFQTLIATKARRVCLAANGDTVLEFGLRRAQGFDGALSATRAAYIGGVHATSNVLAGKLLDIPIKGTHAHAWVMMFDSEREAFEAYARTMPNNCVFLVDTYDTHQGVRTAIEVGKHLRSLGHEMLGIRLDSGDLVALSIDARRMLNEAGFPKAKIVASDSLNEHRIKELKDNGAQIDIWGVGTNLVTAQDQPALGGVYKLSAQQTTTDSEWIPKIKLSNSAIKVSNPGRLQVHRCTTPEGEWVADIMGDLSETDINTANLHHLDGTKATVPKELTLTPLLQPFLRNGIRVKPPESIHQMRSRGQQRQTGYPAIPLLTKNTWLIKKRLIDHHRPIK